MDKLITLFSHPYSCSSLAWAIEDEKKKIKQKDWCELHFIWR
jgi:hypothetical protein